MQLRHQKLFISKELPCWCSPIWYANISKGLLFQTSTNLIIIHASDIGIKGTFQEQEKWSIGQAWTRMLKRAIDLPRTDE